MKCSQSCLRFELVSGIAFLPFFTAVEVIVKRNFTAFTVGPVIWGCRIHWLLLCRGVRPPTNEHPGYDTKQSDGDVPVMLELWGIWNTPSLPSLPGPLWLGVVVPDRVLSMGQMELNCELLLNWIAWNRTVLTFQLCTYANLNCLK